MPSGSASSHVTFSSPLSLACSAGGSVVPREASSLESLGGIDPTAEIARIEIALYSSIELTLSHIMSVEGQSALSSVATKLRQYRTLCDTLLRGVAGRLAQTKTELSAANTTLETERREHALQTRVYARLHAQSTDTSTTTSASTAPTTPTKKTLLSPTTAAPAPAPAQRSTSTQTDIGSVSDAAAAEARLHAAHAALAAAQEDLAQKNARIGRAQDALRSARSALDSLRAERDQARHEVAETTAELRAADREMSGLRAELGAVHARLADAKRAAAVANAQAAAAERMAAAAVAAAGGYDRLRESTESPSPVPNLTVVGGGSGGSTTVPTSPTMNLPPLASSIVEMISSPNTNNTNSTSVISAAAKLSTGAPDTLGRPVPSFTPVTAAPVPATPVSPSLLPTDGATLLSPPTLAATLAARAALADDVAVLTCQHRQLAAAVDDFRLAAGEAAARAAHAAAVEDTYTVNQVVVPVVSEDDEAGAAAELAGLKKELREAKVRAEQAEARAAEIAEESQCWQSAAADEWARRILVLRGALLAAGFDDILQIDDLVRNIAVERQSLSELTNYK